jgi:hypothetical protein
MEPIGNVVPSRMWVWIFWTWMGQLETLYIIIKSSGDLLF